MKKRFISLLLIFCMVITMLPAAFATETKKNPFKDVGEGAWYYKYVLGAYEQGLMVGTSDQTFSPDQNLSRAMVAQILYNKEGKPKTTAQDSFSDVSKTAWYYDAVQWAAKTGITAGIGDGKFAPDADVTREQFATMLYRSAGSPKVSGKLTSFPDRTEVSDWAKDAMLWTVSQSIISGSKQANDLLLLPTKGATRAEAAAMIYRYVKVLDENIKKFTVSFNTDGGSKIEPQTIVKGEKAIEPNAPTKDGFTFAGWFTDKELTKAYDFSVPVNRDIMLYAKWEAIPVEEPTTPPVVDDLDDIDPDIAIYSFDLDTRSIPVNTSKDVTFTAEILVNIPLESDDVKVMDSKGQLIGYMNDEGTNGDTDAEDGLYTLTTTLSGSEEEYINYYITVRGVNSESLTIGYFVPLADNELNDMEKVDNALHELVISDEFKSADIEDRASLVENKLNQLADEGLVIKESIFYYSAEKMFEFEYACGVLGSVMIQDMAEDLNTVGSTDEKKADANDKENAEVETSSFRATTATYNSVSADGNYSALILQAFENSSYRVDFYNNLRNDWNNMGLSTTVDRDVTVADMKNIKGYDVVVFAMHGNHSTPRYNTSSQLPIFSINETVTTTTDKDYSYELNTRKSVRKVTLTTGELKYWVFPRLFEDNYSSTSLKGQMIFSESCKFYGCDCLSTTPDNSMARVFTQKGAPVVVGYHNSVGADYSRDIMKDVVESTFNGNTVTSAVNTAKNAHGVNDANRTDGMERVNEDKYKAYPCIIGNENFVLRADGSLSGVVLNAATEQAIAKATVRVYKDGIEIKKTTTSASGAYKITGLDAGSYILQISASKYKSVRTGITILPGEDTFVETTLLMSISGIVSSSANGTVTNSVTGEGVADVTIKVRNNWNNETGAVKSTSKTNENGYYSISDSAGFYTLEFSKPGFVTVYKNVFVGISAANSFNVAISPESVEGAYRIVLTWGENPNDLDSHMSGLTSSGSSFHVYYSSKNAFDGDSLICNLDLDDTTSYGPETITLNTNTASPYYYYVHRYSGSGSIATSNAQVKVYKGDTLLRTFNAPTDKGTADYWNVFAIVNGRIVINNTITSSPDTTYANVTNEEHFEETQDTESIGETNDVIQESEVTESNNSEETEETEEITDSSGDEVPVDDAA